MENHTFIMVQSSLNFVCGRTVPKIHHFKPVLVFENIARPIQDEIEEKIAPFLNSLEIKSTEAACDTFGRVVDSVFADGKANWGRLFTTILFGGIIAKKLQMCGVPLTQSNEDQLIHYITAYITSTKSEWIVENGGWEYGFVKHFERPFHNMKIRIMDLFKNYYPPFWLIFPV
ncbi:bcl-2-related protein A1-like [Rhineura floridana]|uniref:bcl-2-related protein A1-like n=1 Tax=Rhineura floridana TaxID=261503 RepID=UPI002AC8858B|nr:bcl-2-related protein A1-like [Rhineura floridana]XP_061485686.1 bcl-2-related protein A1-like [Rhineura floridana]